MKGSKRFIVFTPEKTTRIFLAAIADINVTKISQKIHFESSFLMIRVMYKIIYPEVQYLSRTIKQAGLVTYRNS